MDKMIKYSTSLGEVKKKIKHLPKNIHFSTNYINVLKKFKRSYKVIKMENNQNLDENNFL